MSMDEMLLNELYGSEEARADEEVKLAQVELVEAVAVEAGVNLNELDDDELAKFAHYVLSDEDELVEDQYTENQYTEEDYAEAEKIAALQEADLMGRQMAHSYLDELNTATEDNSMYYQEDYENYQDGTEVHEKVASALSDVAEAWAMQKLAEEDNSARNAAIGAAGGAALLGGGAYAGKKRALSKLKGIQSRGSKAVEALQGMTGRLYPAGAFKFDELGAVGGGGGRHIMAKHLAEQQAALKAELGSGTKRALRGLSGAQMAGLGLGGAALAGGGAYLMSRKKKQEKSAALAEAGYEALAIANLYEPDEFAKEAEYRAAEILLANGVHPETFEDVQPEEVKLASFPGVEHAADRAEAEELAEYNEMLDTAALHIIDEILG